MTCPICNQKIDPSDHSEKWGPEFAHSRCVIAFTAGSAVQDAKLQTRIKRLEDACDEAIAFLEFHGPVGATPDTAYLIAKNIRTAKETKP